MSQILSGGVPSSVENVDEAHGSTFVDDAVRAAFPWVLIVMVASMIAVAIGIIVPAIQYHARGEIHATVAIVCGAVAIVACVVFIHLFVTNFAGRIQRNR